MKENSMIQMLYICKYAYMVGFFVELDNLCQ